MATIKESIVDRVRAAGYDFFTACDEADRILAAFKASGARAQTFYIRGSQVAFTLKREG